MSLGGVSLLKKSNTGLIVVDVQGKLARLVHDSEHVIENICKLIKGAHILNIPILWVEQYPAGLGPTVEEIQELLKDHLPIEKITFSAYKNTEFRKAIEATECNSFLLTGIESHVCVYQTGADLLANDYEIEIVEDAVSSRTKENKDIGIKKLNSLGVKSTSVEMCLFEQMETAEYSKFKSVSKLIK